MCLAPDSPFHEQHAALPDTISSYPPSDDSRPGDRFAMDADLTVYWPVVRPCWEERC